MIKQILDVTTTTVVLTVALGAGYTMYERRPQVRPPTPLPTAPISLVGLPAVGRADAPYAILEFSDFECPYCATFATETWPEMKTTLVDTGKVRFVFAPFPLEQIHKYARAAAEAALCSDDFFVAHDFLFSNQAKLKDVVSLVATDRSRSCKANVDAVLDLGKALSVTGTPTFFIGKLSGTSITVTARIPGAAYLSAFTKEIQ